MYFTLSVWSQKDEALNFLSPLFRSTTARSHWLRLLRLDASADRSAIKRAYFELVKTTHPDVAGSSSGAEFARITEAYQALMAASRDATAEDGDETPTASAAREGPAMRARWNIRRKFKPSEFPAWFQPDDGGKNER